MRFFRVFSVLLSFKCFHLWFFGFIIFVMHDKQECIFLAQRNKAFFLKLLKNMHQYLLNLPLLAALLLEIVARVPAFFLFMVFRLDLSFISFFHVLFCRLLSLLFLRFHDFIKFLMFVNQECTVLAQ